MVLRRHHCGRGIGRNRRLADGQHMRAASACVGAEKFEPLNEIINIGFEVKATARQRHIARIFPIGDVDIMRDHHALDCPTQKRRKMPGHRRADEKPGLCTAPFVHETLQLPERFAR